MLNKAVFKLLNLVILNVIDIKLFLIPPLAGLPLPTMQHRSLDERRSLNAVCADVALTLLLTKQNYLKDFSLTVYGKNHSVGTVKTGH